MGSGFRVCFRLGFVCGSSDASSSRKHSRLLAAAFKLVPFSLQLPAMSTLEEADVASAAAALKNCFGLGGDFTVAVEEPREDAGGTIRPPIGTIICAGEPVAILGLTVTTLRTKRNPKRVMMMVVERVDPSPS